MATILVADDAAFMRALLRDILTRGGHTVLSEATNGIETLEKFKTYRPDLVMLDINMPDMNGLEALERLFRINAKAKVIMCSAIGHRETILKSVHRGAKDYILKPFHENRVIEAVHRVLQADTFIAK